MDLAPDIERLVLPKLRKQDASHDLHAMGDENWKYMYSVRAKKSAVPCNDTLDSFFNLYETPSNPSPQALNPGIELARAETLSCQSSHPGADLKLADTLSAYSSSNESVIQLSRQPLNQSANGARSFDNPPDRSPPCPPLGKKYSFQNISLPQIPDMVRQTKQLVHQPRQLSAIDIRQNSFSRESSPPPSKKPDTATLSHPSVEIRTDGANLSQKSKPPDRSFFSILSHLLGNRMSTPSRLFAETVTAASSQSSAISGSSSSRGRTWFSNWFSHTPNESSRRKDEAVDLEMNQHVQVVDEAEYDRRQYHKKDGQKTGRNKARGCLVFCKTFWGRRKI